MSYAVVRSILVGDAMVSNIVGDRVYQVVPQGAKKPFATIQKVSHPRDGHTLAQGHIDIESPAYQVSCFSEDADEAETLAGAVTDAVEASDRADVSGGFVTGSSASYVVGPEGSQKHIFEHRVEVELRLVTS